MSTDPKKFVGMSVFAYFMAAMLFLAGMQMSFSWIPVVIFSSFSLLVMVSCMLALWKQYKRYEVPMYLFLFFIGLGLTIFYLICDYITLF